MMGLQFRQLLLVVGMMFLVFCASSSTWSQGNLHIGNSEVHPYARVEQRYDDNVFLDPDGEKEDFVTTIMGGVRLELPLREHRFELGYEIRQEEYWDFSDQSFTEHNIFLEAHIQSTKGFGLKIEDRFTSTSDRPDAEDVLREERIRNIGSATVDYRMNLLAFDLGYTNILDDYDERDFLDRIENIIGLTAIYDVFAKASVLGEYRFGWINYDESTSRSDADYHQLAVGVRGELTPKLTGLLKGGYQWRDYDSSAVDDFDGGVVTANLTHDYSERTQVRLLGDWGVTESSYDLNNYYRLTRVMLEIDQDLANKFSLNLQGSFYHNKYPEETTELTQTAKRKDDILMGTVGLYYQTQEWLSTGISYSRRERSSNLDVFDYSNNQVAIEASVNY